MNTQYKADTMFINKANICFSFAAAVLFSVLLPISSILEVWKSAVVFLCVYVSLFVLSWIFFGIVSLTVRRDREYGTPSRFYNFVFNLGYGYLCELARIRIHITGLEKVPKNGVFLLVSNHRSNFDNMIQSYVLRDRYIAYISKPENFKIPIGRGFMRRNAYIAIDREDPRKAIRAVNRAAELLRSGNFSVGVFPEGHRCRDGEMSEFKTGCFLPAVKAKCPVVVACITGTENITRNFPLRKTHVHLDFVSVLTGDEVRSRSTSEISDEVYKILCNHLKDKGEQS